MNTRLVVIVALLSLAAADAVGRSLGLVLEGLQPAYQSVADVTISLRNVGDAPLWLDSFLMGTVLVERRAQDTGKWETGSYWRCGNSGRGSPQILQVGDTVEVRLMESWPFRLDGDPPWFELQDGRKRPVPGRYRLLVRYSYEEWSDIFHIPSADEILTVYSKEFKIDDEGR
jgi:hypothetical protein